MKGNIVLVYLVNKKSTSFCSLLIDLVIYKQAKEYVSCTDKKYIKELDKYYKKNFNSLDKVRIKLFNELLD